MAKSIGIDMECHLIFHSDVDISKEEFLRAIQSLFRIRPRDSFRTHWQHIDGQGVNTYTEAQLTLMDATVKPDESMPETMETQLMDAVIVGGNHLASALHVLGCHPSAEDDYDAVLQRFGQPAADMWMTWRAIRNLAEYERFDDK